MALLISICSFGFGDSGGYLFGGIGAVADRRLLDASEDFPQNPTYATVSGGFCYKFSDSFALGAWIGGMYNVPPPIIGGIKLVFWNIDEAALAVNLGIVPSIGFMYKGFFVNAMLGMIETDKHYNDEGTLLREVTFIRPYIELGYSFKIF